jgi:4-diphosphocytidyl-2-C-methyl-D-erythritol kinase
VRTIKQKIPAKINLTLDIVGKTTNYHKIKSLVASINLYDTITVKKRRDNLITLSENGFKANCPVEENNAYKTAKVFMDMFFTPGVDIFVKKKIPLAGGLGGSSADSVAVLKAMNKLYDINGAMSPLALKIGSDTCYMLKGGFAVLSGRGTEVERVRSKHKLYLIIIVDETGVPAKDGYSLYDKMDIEKNPTTDLAVSLITKRSKGALEHFSAMVKNDLYLPAVEKVPAIKTNVDNLIESGAIASTVSGSGSCTYGIFKSRIKRNKAYKKLLELYPEDKLIKVHTI